MKLWIVTIGSSDVQLDSDKISREKKRKAEQYSDKVWRYWYKNIKPDCYDISFVPKTAFPDLEETYRIPSRVLGTVYQENSAEVQEEIWSYLTFPLLEQFTKHLKNLGVPDAIAYLLTDQSAIFRSDEDRRESKSPYWDDTCKLEPILQRYFSQEYPGVTLISLKLSPPDTKYGLDDWNNVLSPVQNELNKIQLASEPDTVYVSHQAGTPAISSAVQFMSLGKFAEKVQFLVSNEYKKKALEPIKSSKYLKAIKLGQAKELLKNHDYAAVKSLLNDDLDDETQILLDAAIQWNYAKFDDFAKKLQTLSDEKLVEQVNERTKEENWWWTAYEAAYLATIRLEQGNTVEAFFHAFRAVEGTFLEWGKHEFKSHIEINNDRAYLQPSILCDSKQYFKDAKINPDKPEKNNSLGNLKLKFQELDNRLNNQEKDKQKPKGELLYGTTLYRLFETQKPDYKNMPEYKRFTAQDGISDKRNKNFHQLQGLTEQDCYRDWEVNNLEEWEERILKYLNFIAQPDLPEPLFTSLEDASLMAQVHQKLEEAINSY